MFEKYFSKKRQLRGSEIEEITENSSDIDETRVVGSAVSGKRLRVFRGIVFLCFALLGARVFYLQIAKGEYYGELSRENRVRAIVIKAPRGIIYDRNGKKLVNNVPSYDLIAIPADIPKDENAESREVADIAGI